MESDELPSAFIGAATALGGVEAVWRCRKQDATATMKTAPRTDPTTAPAITTVLAVVLTSAVASGVLGVSLLPPEGKVISEPIDSPIAR